jgi:hypothetical protein
MGLGGNDEKCLRVKNYVQRGDEWKPIDAGGVGRIEQDAISQLGPYHLWPVV